jgi:hypothetical protein
MSGRDDKEALVNKWKGVVAAGICLVSLALVWVHVRTGGLMFGREDRHRQKVGYCFDVAMDGAGHRLLVTAGERGLHVFDSDSGELRYVMTSYDDGYYRNLKVWQERAYVVDSRRGLVVLDISGETPVTTWVQPRGGAAGLHVVGSTAFVAAFGDGLQVFDLSDPDSPVTVGSTATAGSAWDVWAHDGFAYVADFNAGLTVVDVSPPAEPRVVTTVTWAKRYQSAEIVRGEGSFVYVAAADHGLVIIDVSDPRHPVVTSQYRPFRIGAAEGLAVRDGLVYLAVGSQIEFKGGRSDLEMATTKENGLHVIDATDPRRPVLLGKISFLGWVEGVHLAGDIAYVANAFTGVRAIDVRDPSRPILVDSWNGP